VRIVSGTAVWHHNGMPLAPIRWVLVRDPFGERDPQAFPSTDLDASPLEILNWFVGRWTTETTFEEVRRHLGVKTQRQQLTYCGYHRQPDGILNLNLT